MCNCSMLCSTLLYVHSNFVIILMGKRESWLLYIGCLPKSNDCCVALRRGAIVLSAVCDCGIS